MLKTKRYACTMLTAVLALMLFSLPGFSQTAFYHAPMTYDGGPDMILYNGDTVMLGNTLVDDASGIANRDSISFGLSYLYSTYYMNTFLELSYAPLKFLEVGTSIPYLFRTLKDSEDNEYKKTGYGDTAFFVRLCFRNLFNLIDSTTSLNVTAPTGDPVALDGFEVVPLGYGNVTAGIRESVSWKLPSSITKLPVRIFANVALQYYSSVEIETNAMDRETYDDYLAFSYLIGGEYTVLPYLALQLKWSMIFLPERNYETENLSTGDTVSASRHDNLVSSDIVLAVKYSVLQYFSGSLIGVVPLFDIKSSEARGSVKHQWKVMASFSKSFDISSGSPDMRPAAPGRKR